MNKMTGLARFGFQVAAKFSDMKNSFFKAVNPAIATGLDVTQKLRAAIVQSAPKVTVSQPHAKL